ncbi:MAG TPA: hypothetical protein VH328_10500 [Burkholderiaceae bacterium]|nr:hypothetical protein [Burkholderiaceae bacterium]
MEASLVELMLAELRDVSDDLAAAGRTSARLVARQFGRSSSLRACLESSRRLSELVPRLLAETPATLDRRLSEVVETRTPRRAWASRHPRDFVATAHGIVPARWWTELSGMAVSLSHLSRVVDALDAQASRLRMAQARLRKFVQDAAQSLAGHSGYATADLASLRDLLETVDATLAVLLRARERVARRLPARRGYALRPERTWPSTPAWTTLRRMLKDVHLSSDSAQHLAAETLARPVAMADLPFLYQRWVALQVLNVFVARHWRLDADPTGALWLGGRIVLADGQGAQVDMWIEPRLLPLGNAHRHPSGMASGLRGIEQTPDIVLLLRTAVGAEEGYVLDATLSSDGDVLGGKAKYLESIQLSAPRRITGVMLPRAPLRSWAVAPLRGAQCRPFDPHGHSGVIPLRPGEGGPDLGGLRDWLDELTDRR